MNQANVALRMMPLLMLMALRTTAASAQWQRLPRLESGPGMVLKIENLRPDARFLKTYITFGGGGVLDASNLANSTLLVKGVSYELSELAEGVLLRRYESGRIFVSLGAPLMSPSEHNGYAPNFANPSLADFTTRWDKIEITCGPGGEGSSGGANLSAQDFFGIPLRISTSGGTQTPVTLTWRASTAVVFRALGQLSNYAVSTPQNATGAIALGNNGVAVAGVSGGPVVRIISPASVAPVNSHGDTVYPSFADYISYLRTSNPTSPTQPQPVATIIAGNNGQIVSGGPFQTYNLTVTISNSSKLIGNTRIAEGDLVFEGTVNNGAGQVPTTILVPALSLTDHDIYGANPDPPPRVIQGADTNGIVAKVVADYFSALNFGFAGSPTDNPAMPGITIGDSPSWTWYGNNPSGQNQPALPITDAFAFAQPTNPGRFNQFAAYLTGVSDAYGFAYNDRLQSPLAALSDGSTLTLSILPDTQ